MKLFAIWGFVFLITTPYLRGQDLSPDFSQTFTQDWKKAWLSSGQKEFYISEDGERIIFLTDRVFQIRDGSDGSLLSSGDLLPKRKKLMNAISFDGNDVVSDAANNFDFAEGAGFAVYPEENMMLMLDWNSDKNYVKAFDLENGKIIWDTDQYQFAASLEQMIARALLQSVAQRAVTTAYMNSASFAGDIFLQGVSSTIDEQAYETARRSGYATFSAATFVTPLEGTGKILVRSSGELIAVDLASGEEQWRFGEFPLVVGFHRMLDDERVLLVNNNRNILQKEGGSRTSVVLDVNTGEELLRFDPKTSFMHDRTYLLGDHLVMASEGLEIFDLNTGKRLVYTLQDEDKDPEKASSFGKFLGQEDGADSGGASAYVGSLYDGRDVYTTYARDVTGTTVLPAARGLVTKINLAKFDPLSAERIWLQEKIASSIVDIPFANQQEVVLVKDPAFGAPRWLIVDAESGELKKEMKMASGYAFRAGPSTIWNDDVAYYADKKGISIYSTSSWEEENFVDIGDLGIGKMQTMVQHQDGLMIVCDKGVAFLDENGGLLGRQEIKRIRGAAWNNRHCLVFTKKDTQVLSMEESKHIGTLNYTPVDDAYEFYITADNDKVITITRQQELRAYSLK